MTKILKLTLNKKWFDMILSGEKKEEYREIKRHWIQRLCEEVEWEKNYTSNFNGVFKYFDFVEFSNGYGDNVPKMIVRFNSLEIKEGNPDWGAEKGVEYFVIKLGEVTDTKNTIPEKEAISLNSN